MCFNDKHDVSDRCQRLVLRVILLWLLVPAIVGCSRETLTTDQAGAGSAAAPNVAEAPKPDGAENPVESEPRTTDASDPPATTIATRLELLSQVTDHLNSGRSEQAKSVLRQLLLRDPEDYEAVFRLANAEAAEGNLSGGIELLSGIPSDHPEAGLPSLGVSADWCFETKRYAEAEQRYRKVLEVDPTINFARRKLAYLLNRQGRRHEAVALIRQLCLSGDVTQDELHSLIVEADAIYDAPGTQPAPGTRPYWPIGPMGQARYLFTQKRYRESVELIAPLMKAGDASPSVIAFFGRAAVEAQDDEGLALWRDHLDDSVKGFPDYWAAIGTYLVREAKYESAVRALAEAVRLDPTDLRSIRRVFQGLRSMDRSDDADTWIERYALMNQILRESNAIAVSDGLAEASYETLAGGLESVGRNLEAILWRSFAATKASDDNRLAVLKQALKRTLADGTAFPSSTQSWCGMNLGAGTLPEVPQPILALSGGRTQVTERLRVPGSADAASFRDITQQIGLDHTYLIAKEPEEKRFAIYQAYGGGVAVVDFDLDGESDLYLAQGGADPADFVADESDRLYRNTRQTGSRTVADVTESAGLEEHEFTVGATSGDWNQDGLPDLAAANIGVNRLMINQGDGTFRIQELDESPDRERFCTSLAMGDVSGDHLPDLFVLNYLRDPEITRLPELDATGNVVNAVPPLSYKPSRDQLYTNHKDGTWDVKNVGESKDDACTGLGIVLTDLSPKGAGNEVFVGNDVMRNQFWMRDDDQNLVDVAAPLGCAYGSLGASTGSMGIAVADLDRSGTLDLHVSNYVEEPSSLFVNRDGIYRDLNVRFNLAADSTPYVGFGSQSIDYSNNGWLDLVVTNGHVEDLESRGQIFRQPIQLFANLGAQFELVDVPNSKYWSTPHLGRALARLDFDGDGKMDFVVTDLLEPTTMLLNESPSTNHWIKLQLVGTVSERDAIGAKVELQSTNGSWVAWVTAGDGYLSKNESVVHFGLGRESAIQSVKVTWPNSTVQTFKAMTVNESWLLVEGNSDPFALD